MSQAPILRDLAIGAVGSLVAAAVLGGFSLLPLAWSVAAGLLVLLGVESWLLWRHRGRQSSVSGAAIGLMRVNTGHNTAAEDLVSTAVQSFEFWGISGKRTVSNPRVQQAMIRIARNGGAVRFLLLSPVSPNMRLRAADERESADAWINDIRATHSRLQQLAEREQIKIDVRFFDQYPVWRMYILDRRSIYLNWFLPGKQGPESPELLLESVTDGLSSPLLREFDESWKEAKDDPS